MKSLQVVGKRATSEETGLPKRKGVLSYARRVVFPSFAWACITASCIIGIGGLSLLDSPDWVFHRVYSLGLWTGVATLISSLVWRTRYRIDRQ